MTLDLILIGLVITLEPIPLTAFVLILASKNGVRKGAAFILGWLGSLAAVVAITLAATGNEPPKSNTAPATAALVVKILIGVALVVVGLRRRQALGKPKPPKKTPKWQSGIDTCPGGTPWHWRRSRSHGGSWQPVWQPSRKPS